MMVVILWVAIVCLILTLKKVYVRLYEDNTKLNAVLAVLSYTKAKDLVDQSSIYLQCGMGEEGMQFYIAACMAMAKERRIIVSILGDDFTKDEVEHLAANKEAVVKLVDSAE